MRSIKRLQIIPVLLAACVLFGATGRADAAQPLDRIVAVVNDDVILWSDLVKARSELEKENLLAGRQESLNDKDLLQRLIDDKLAAQEAKRLNIEVTPKEVEGAVADVLRQYQLDLPGLKARLKEQGISYKDYTDKIEEQIRRLKLTNRAVRSRVVVDQSKMQAYYSQHRDEFAEEPKVHLQQVMFTGPNAVSKANQLYAMKSVPPQGFATAVENLGGETVDLKTLSLSSLDTELLNKDYAAAARQLEPGEFSPPFQAGGSTQLLYLQERIPARIRTFDEVKSEIEERLGREETEKQFAKWLLELRDKSIIQIKL
jgi:parvulin-like peptidyl-prolyl isomerase